MNWKYIKDGYMPLPYADCFLAIDDRRISGGVDFMVGYWNNADKFETPADGLRAWVDVEDVIAYISMDDMKEEFYANAKYRTEKF